MGEYSGDTVDDKGDEHEGDDEANAHASRGHVYLQQVGARADFRNVSLSRDAFNLLGSSNFRARFLHFLEIESWNTIFANLKCFKLLAQTEQKRQT